MTRHRRPTRAPRKIDERTGTRAVVRYVRVSAYKAREVLDLIRGKDVARGRRDPAVHRARRRHRDPQVPGLGRRQRREQRRPGPRRALRVGLLRRRGPDAQALPPPGPWPGHPHPQAHLPHHGHREPAARGRARAPRAKEAARAGRRPRRRRRPAASPRRGAAASPPRRGVPPSSRDEAEATPTQGEADEPSEATTATRSRPTSRLDDTVRRDRQVVRRRATPRTDFDGRRAPRPTEHVRRAEDEPTTAEAIDATSPRPTEHRGRPTDAADDADGRRRTRRRTSLMGQKVNPYGFRLGVTTDWKSRWFADKRVRRLRHRGLEDPRLPHDAAAPRGDQPHRGRAHP